MFFQDVTEKPKRDLAARPLEPGSSGSDLADEGLTSAEMRFAKFRWIHIRSVIRLDADLWRRQMQGSVIPRSRLS